MIIQKLDYETMNHAQIAEIAEKLNEQIPKISKHKKKERCAQGLY